MSGLVLVIGVIAGVTLSTLLACTILDKGLKFWPTPGKGSWQSRLFWTLFRTLNVATLALAFLDWQRWDGFSLGRGLGATLAVVAFALYGWACYALGRRNLYCGRDGLVTGGIYSWTRNPQYATAIPAYIGLAVASDSVAVFGTASLLTLSFVLMAFAEEHWLEAAYGADYSRYRAEVARFYNWRHALAVLKQEVMPAKEASEEAPL
jgi:protein-S-isoprenylcysteine O-methyltransferase Ste14